MPDFFQYGIVKTAHLLPSAKLDDQKYEFIFILDRSGSMAGSTSYSGVPNIDLARPACVLFLKSLPTDCFFNVIGFGSNYKTLFPESVRYSQANLDTAVQYANSMTANMGENEVELPLQHVYRSSGIKGYMTQIFVLTDGCQEFQTPRIKQIAKVIEDNKARARVFSLGIGQQASIELVTLMASTGAGTSSFVFGDDTIQSKVLEQLRIALKAPLLHGIRVLK